MCGCHDKLDINVEQVFLNLIYCRAEHSCCSGLLLLLTRQVIKVGLAVDQGFYIAQGSNIQNVLSMAAQAWHPCTHWPLSTRCYQRGRPSWPTAIKYTWISWGFTFRSVTAVLGCARCCSPLCSCATVRRKANHGSVVRAQAGDSMIMTSSGGPKWNQKPTCSLS